MVICSLDALKTSWKKKEARIKKQISRGAATSRSSHQRCSMKKGVLRNFTKFTGKHLCQSLLFNKVAGLRPATLLKKRLWHRCFPVNFAKFLRTPFLQNTSGRLLLNKLVTVERDRDDEIIGFDLGFVG